MTLMIQINAVTAGTLFSSWRLSKAGRPLSEDRLMEIFPDGTHSEPVRVALQHPFNAFFTATDRGGSAHSATLDLFVQTEGVAGTKYARIAILGRCTHAMTHGV